MTTVHERNTQPNISVASLALVGCSSIVIFDLKHEFWRCQFVGRPFELDKAILSQLLGVAS